MINESDDMNYEQHWDNAYQSTATEKLGWYEKESTPTLQLINEIQLPKNAKILNVGAGSSTVIDGLLTQDYQHIIVNDISLMALESLKNRLGSYTEKLQFIQDDLTNPQELQNLQVDLWNDRAVLHFFLTDVQQNAYFKLLKQVVKPGGYVIIAVFALNGAEKCCKLSLKRYNAEMLQEKLGDSFTLLKKFDYTFVNPFGGERPYIYTLFQKNT